jgi:hypothetical protein
MRRFKRFTGLVAAVLIIVTAAFPSISRAAPQQGEPMVVGRVSHIEGQLLRYVYEEKDWVPIVKDVPFGLEDTLYSDQDAKAEFIFPNSTWIRIGGSTQIQAIALNDEVTEVDVASGMARFYNRGTQSVVKATTSFGYVLAPAGSMFDLYVGDQSLEVIALKGSVDFVHARSQSRYEVHSGSSSMVADEQQVAAGQGTVDADFDDWNAQRDSLWAKRLEVKGDSTRYIPPELHDDAYELEENGRWERVQYEGEYRNLWRPTRVSADWTPYSTGRWTTYYGDQCWVPNEPFGYTTHHYGSWVFVDSCRCWYWAPPVRTVVVGRPWTVGYGWYPGRVSWIHSDANVGWVPLAPYEPYYSQNYWGPSSVAVASLNLATAIINLSTLHHLDRAVFVGHRNFWGVNNYHNHRVRNINRTTIINNYYGSHVVNNRVIRDFDRRRDRFNFVNTDVRMKPHRSVVERIERNQRLAERRERRDGRSLLLDARNTRQGTFARDARIEHPKVRNRLVAGDSVDKPLSDVRFQERELKRQERQQRTVDERIMRKERPDDGTRKPDERQQLQRDERQPQREIRPQQPDGETRPGAGGERVRPQRPSPEKLEQRSPRRDEGGRGQDEQPQPQKRQELREPRQRGSETPQETGTERVRPQRPSPEKLEQRRPQRDEQLQDPEQQRQEPKQQRDRRLRKDEQAPDPEQQRQMREERQRSLQQQQQQGRRPESRPMREGSASGELEQQRQMREERQRSLQQQQQQQGQRQERRITREERAPEFEQQRQMREERQRSLQQQQQQRGNQQERRPTREERAPELEQQRQMTEQRQQQGRRQEQPRNKKHQRAEEEQQQNPELPPSR